MQNKVLSWVKEHVLYSGGLEAWAGSGQAYPEVSGYIIPTLIKHRQTDLACDLGEWLVKTQNADGSWYGLDGRKQVFDTAAIVEGLDALGDPAAEKGRAFLRSAVGKDRRLVRFPGDDQSPCYLARAAWIMGDPAAMAHYIPSSAYPAAWGKRQRPHYIAYALEGLYSAGHEKEVGKVLTASVNALRLDDLMPFWIGAGWIDGEGSDLCATAQFAQLYATVGMLTEAAACIGAVERHIKSSGGIPQSLDDGREISWAAKYYLDFMAGEA